MKKRIVLLGSAYPLRGGLANYNERLAKAYLDRGDEVIIYTFSLQYPNFLFPGKTQYSNSKKPDNLDIRIKVNSINPFNWIKIGNEIKQLQADILIIKYWLPFMSPCFSTIARRTRKNKKTRIISILDNIIPHEKRLADRILSKYFTKSVDGFVAMSKSVLNDLNIFDTKKPRIFNPHPIYDNFGEIIPKDKAKKMLGLDSQQNYMLFFGFIRDYKGLDLLIEAFANETFRSMNLKLIVAGEFYSNKEKYFDLIQKHQLQDHILMHNNFIDDEKVGQYFSACDIVVQPYKSATQSGVTQIAYHFEKPMLVTDVGGLSEIVPHGKVGYVVEADSNIIAKSIIDYYEHNREEAFIANTRIEKQRYSWEKMLESIDYLIKETKD